MPGELRRFPGIKTNSTMKICTKCRVPQDEGSFCRNNLASDGLHSWCKQCVRNDMRRKRRITNPRIKEQEFISATVSIENWEAPCDTGDIRNTKLWNNRHFVSGDGGYQQYISRQ